MTVETVINDQVLATAERLIVEMRCGNEDQAAKALDELVRAREVSLFQELGKLTREFHDALASFRVDSRVSDLAEKDIPDARERLNHVITMTQNAADRTMSAVEHSLPLVEDIANVAVNLRAQWQRFQKREMNAQEFRELAKSIDLFLGTTETKSADLKAKLNDVLLAQDFQDLTGQIIKRVITLVEDVEANLVNLIKLSSQKVVPVNNHHDAIKAEGPVVPGVKTDGAVSGQDAVDDLLLSLGF
ncbi:MAG: protein phosphatase CheZ [Gammaproteobacteria bacterium]|nr:protein phosphatase CheZ [Gammaproteobacteria bacterium]